MMRLYCFLFILLGCQPQEDNNIVRFEYPKSKLEVFLEQTKDSIYEHVDLSNDFLMEWPNLSGYKIRSLDLSHNYIEKDECYRCHYPKMLEKLDLSHNWIIYNRLSDNGKATFSLSAPFSSPLRDVNLSHNYIQNFFSMVPLNRLDLSHNNLGQVHMMFQGKMDYLNLSDNPDLFTNHYFDLNKIDTLLRENSGEGKKIIGQTEYWIRD